MKVEIWADLVCPWCYVGQARFKKALAGFAHRDQVEVVYRSFELDPSAPQAGDASVIDMLASKYGMSRAQAEAADQRVAGLAADEGLPFSADRKHGSTFDAHRLLQFAAAAGQQDAVVDGLYRAHFGGTGSIFDTPSIAAVAEAAGLDADQARKVLGGTDFTEQVRADERRAAELGVTGVPFFVADGRLAAPGAQSTEVLASLLGKAWETSGAAA